MTDTERLDWLESHGVVGLNWIARNSTTGRGYRLHQGPPHGVEGYATAREAIDAVVSEQAE